jgi:hypothetical protein
MPNTGLKFEAVLANSLISFGLFKICRIKGPSVPGFLTFQNKTTSASEFSKIFKGISGFCEGTSKELAVQVGSLRSSSIS